MFLMTKTTYTATYTTATGETISQTRTSHRTYTHAAFYDLGEGHTFFSFHGSEALAAKGTNGWKPRAIVSLSDGRTTAAQTTAAQTTADDKCDGRPAEGQGTRINKKCAKCNHVGVARAWRKHTAK